MCFSALSQRNSTPQSFLSGILLTNMSYTPKIRGRFQKLISGQGILLERNGLGLIVKCLTLPVNGLTIAMIIASEIRLGGWGWGLYIGMFMLGLDFMEVICFSLFCFLTFPCYSQTSHTDNFFN